MNIPGASPGLVVGPTVKEPELLLDPEVLMDFTRHPYWDEYTGLPLPVEETEKARALELDTTRNPKAWMGRTKPEIAKVCTNIPLAIPENLYLNPWWLTGNESGNFWNALTGTGT